MKKSFRFKNLLSYLTIAFLAIAFFVLSSLFNYLSQSPDYLKFLAPDEAANYYFTKQYAETSSISVFEPANLIAEEVVRPRSIRSDFAYLKPVSFLGIIIIYGKIASYLGTAIIPFLGPIFSSLGIIFFYFLIRRFFGNKIALISSVLLFSFPVYFFYTARSMFHNSLFISLLIISFFFLSRSLPLSKKPKFLDLKTEKTRFYSQIFAFLGGVFLALSVSARASELIWLAPVLFLIFIFYARRLGLINFLLILAGFSLAILPSLYFNIILYSSPFFGGYGEMNQSILEIGQASGQFIQSSIIGDFSYYRSLFNTLFNNVFYFGFHPKQSILMFYYYVLRMFPYLSALAILGVLIFIFKIIRKAQKGAYLYLISFILLSTILVLYYGSWQFNDNPDPSRFTIGNSYTRYWLPIYIMALPWIALALKELTKALEYLLSLIAKKSATWPKIFSHGALLLITLALVFNNFNFLVFGSEEGLATLYHNHKTDKLNARELLSLTEEQSIIITQYHDKQLFPERRVINALLNNDEVNRSLEKIIDFYPIYYYNFSFPQKDYDYLNTRRLASFGLQIEFIKNFGDFSLYRLYKLEPEPEATRELKD